MNSNHVRAGGRSAGKGAGAGKGSRSASGKAASTGTAGTPGRNPATRRAPLRAGRPDAAAVDPAIAVPPPPRMGWREAIAATVSGLGFELVDVERAQRGLLRVTIDRVPGRSYPVAGEYVIVDDCEQVTRQLQYVLEVEGMDYARLEVSSPGLDRPLKSEADFERFSGQAVALVLKLPFQGRKAWQGELGRSEDGTAWRLRLKVGKDEQELVFGFDEVRDARLVPVVDFKGRLRGADPSSEDGPAAEAQRGHTGPAAASRAGESQE